MEVSVKVEGLDKIIKKLDSLTAEPLRNALKRSALYVEREAKVRVPVDTGTLRRSLTSIVDPSPVPTWAQVGTNVAYARYVHEGRKPGSMPPVSSVARWARKRGLNPYLVARAIARKGTKAQPFLKDAFEASRGAIQATLEHAAQEIRNRWVA